MGGATMTQKISARIRDLREKRGLTRSQLASAVGVTFAGVFNWEEKDREPRIDTLTRLAEVLGVSAHYLMTGKEGPKQAEPPKAAKTIDALLKKAQSDFAAAMGLPRERVRVTVEEIIGPVAGEISRRIRSR
jgi:transcriptional regulator with XRE-family HTH domain